MMALIVAGLPGIVHAGDEHRRVLLVMGDSLSAAYGLAPEQGWVALLGDRLQQRDSGWRVVNASVSGETSAGGAARVEAAFAEHDPDALLIELGANDGLRGLPVEQARGHLQRMIDVAKAHDAAVLLVGMRMPPNYGPAYTQQFEAMYRQLADDNAVALVPFLLAPIATDRSAFQDDNLHPVAAAEPALLEHLWPTLAPVLGLAP